VVSGGAGGVSGIDGGGALGVDEGGSLGGADDPAGGAAGAGGAPVRGGVFHRDMLDRSGAGLAADDPLGDAAPSAARRVCDDSTRSLWRPASAAISARR
jgi:hypothetical protein